MAVPPAVHAARGPFLLSTQDRGMLSERQVPWGRNEADRDGRLRCRRAPRRLASAGLPNHGDRRELSETGCRARTWSGVAACRHRTVGKAQGIGAVTTDEYGRDLDHARLWAEARTLVELCELTAKWLEGGITYQPGYGAAGPDPETSALVPVLARVNRAGFLTEFSQPGEREWQQRAAVGGFCDEAVMWQLRAAAFCTDLVVLPYAPGSPNDALQIPVTLDRDEESTWVGGALEPADLVYHYGYDVHRDGVLALVDSWQVTVLDPVWGRNDLLWKTLERLTDDSTFMRTEGERMARALNERINPE